MAVVGRGGAIYYGHVDDLGTLDMSLRIVAERVVVGWLKERVESRKLGAQAPPIPRHLLG